MKNLVLLLGSHIVLFNILNWFKCSFDPQTLFPIGFICICLIKIFLVHRHHLLSHLCHRSTTRLFILPLLYTMMLEPKTYCICLFVCLFERSLWFNDISITVTWRLGWLLVKWMYLSIDSKLPTMFSWHNGIYVRISYNCSLLWVA